MLYQTGRWVLGDAPGNAELSDASFKAFFDGVLAGHWAHVSHVFYEVIHPMLVSFLPISILVWIIFFYPLQALIRRFQEKRAQLILKARARKANKQIARGKKLGVTEK
jgi:uncharacterized protein (DUF2062 family)